MAVGGGGGVDDDGRGGGGGRTGRHAASRQPLERRSILVLQINGRHNESQALPRCDTVRRGEEGNKQPMRRRRRPCPVHKANNAADRRAMLILLT